MNANLELYRVFKAVAENLNITKAANILHISQPAVTQLIKKLENELDVHLFVRTKRGVVLTDEGNVLYQYIKEAIDIIHNGENKLTELKNLDAGTIRIGISTTLTREFLLPYIAKFHKLYPNIIIDINTSLAKDLIPLLRNGGIDLMIMNLISKIDRDIKVIPCKTIQDCFVVGNDLKDQFKSTIYLRDLNKYPLLLQAKSSNTRAFIDNWAAQNGVVLNPIMDIASYSLVIEFTKIGMGIGYVTKDYVQEDLKNQKLYELKVEPAIPPRKIGIAIKKNSVLTFATSKLIDLIIKNR